MRNHYRHIQTWQLAIWTEICTAIRFTSNTQITVAYMSTIHLVHQCSLATFFIREVSYIFLLTSCIIFLHCIFKRWVSFYFSSIFHMGCGLRYLYSKICPPLFPLWKTLIQQSIVTVLVISSNHSFPGSILSLEASSLTTFPHFLCPWVAL